MKQIYVQAQADHIESLFKGSPLAAVEELVWNALDADAKEELKRALKAYKGSILLICHEPEFYNDVATDVWNCEDWTTVTL